MPEGIPFGMEKSMDRTPRPNEIYQHFKGNLYRVITLAKHADTGELLVIYQALYGSFEVFARPLSEFTGRVDREKYPDAAAEYRFTLLPQVMGQAVPEENAAPKREELLPPPDGAKEDGAHGEEALSEQPELDPMLLSFLDADTYDEKMAIYTDIRGRITDDMLTTMAVSLDIDLKEGELMDRYEELKNCILMLEKYECNRLR